MLHLPFLRSHVAVVVATIVAGSTASGLAFIALKAANVKTILGNLWIAPNDDGNATIIIAREIDVPGIQRA